MIPPLKILCFNIHGGYSLDGRRDLGRVHALLEDLDIDIAVFQEMETRPSRGGTAADVDKLAGSNRPHHMMGPTMKEGLGWYGNLLVSKHPIKRAQVHTLEKKWDIEPRNAVDCVIETPLGTLRIIGTHLSLAAWERKTEVPMLIDLVRKVEAEEKHPVFLMGDINEWRASSKLLKYLGSVMTELPAGKSFPVFFPLFRLDRVWHDSAFVRAKAVVLDTPAIRKLSDHLPLYIEVEDLKP